MEPRPVAVRMREGRRRGGDDGPPGRLQPAIAQAPGRLDPRPEGRARAGAAGLDDAGGVGEGQEDVAAAVGGVGAEQPAEEAEVGADAPRPRFPDGEDPTS
ncbi:MAG: hypothetical protein ACFCGT_12890 [Sandaracinaceae bacterium]